MIKRQAITPLARPTAAFGTKTAHLKLTYALAMTTSSGPLGQTGRSNATQFGQILTALQPCRAAVNRTFLFSAWRETVGPWMYGLADTTGGRR